MTAIDFGRWNSITAGVWRNQATRPGEDYLFAGREWTIAKWDANTYAVILDGKTQLTRMRRADAQAEATLLADQIRREAREKARLDNLTVRFPGLSPEAAAELVTEMRANGSASFCHEGHTIRLTPSAIEGSTAIWAKRV